MALSPTQEVLADLLNLGARKRVADFLADPKNRAQMHPFFSLYDEHLPKEEQLDYDALVRVFREGSDQHVEIARDYIGDCIACNESEIPKSRIRLPANLKRQVARKEAKEELLLLVATVGSSLRDVISLDPLRIARAALVTPVKASAELTAGVLGALGLPKRERQMAVASAVIPLVAAQAFNMLVVTNDAQAALNTGTLDGRGDITDTRTGLGKTDRLTQGSVGAYDRESITDLINSAVKDALGNSFGRPEARDIPFLSVRADGTIKYKDWTVPQEVYASNGLTAQIIPLPESYIFAVQSLESSFRPNVINEIGACGLSQFVPDTLAEKTFKYASLIGFPEAKSLITRFVRKRDDQGRPYYGHRPNNTADEKKLVELCLNTDFNTRLAGVNMILDIGKLQRGLAEHAQRGHDHFPVTEAQAYVAHFAGGGAGLKLLTDIVAHDGKRHAYEFFSMKARNNDTNKKLLYVNGDTSKPRTTSEFMAFLQQEKGLSNNVLPDMRNWKSVRTQIAQAVQDIEGEAAQNQLTQHQGLDRPIRDEKPRLENG